MKKLDYCLKSVQLIWLITLVLATGLVIAHLVQPKSLEILIVGSWYLAICLVIIYPLGAGLLLYSLSLHNKLDDSAKKIYTPKLIKTVILLHANFPVAVIYTFIGLNS